jgi:hypothetical protein
MGDEDEEGEVLGLNDHHEFISHIIIVRATDLLL